MSDTTKIQSFTHVVPMIYAYNTPGVTYHEGWTKIGYTEKQTVSQRINQQVHTDGNWHGRIMLCLRTALVSILRTGNFILI